MPAYAIVRDPTAEQPDGSPMHLGGQPCMPSDIALPACQLCGARMTFSFQVVFPNKHPWAGHAMAVFACTSCSDLQHVMPPMSPNLKHLPGDFLETYEKNFKIFAFDPAHAVRRTDYEPVLQFERVTLEPLKSASTRATKVGGTPNWRISNDFPSTYMGREFGFLMQIWSGQGDDFEFAFTKREDAPFQAQYPWMGDPWRRDGKYTLFSGVPLYFFGTMSLEPPRVYVLNQK
jgi:hypothetical protein